jgi:hypothetical protein
MFSNGLAVPGPHNYNPEISRCSLMYVHHLGERGRKS